MNEDILKNLEDISENLEYLIQYLQDNNDNKSTNPDTTSLDNISNDFNSFNIYLKSIDTNIQNVNQKVSAYLDNITSLDNTTTDNPELQQFNQSINTLISKLDDLKNNISNTSETLNLNIDTTQIDSIKEKLQSDFMINFDITNFDNTVNEINQRLETLSNTSIDFNFSNSIIELNNLVVELNKLRELDFNNINFNITNLDNIEKIIEDLTKLESFSNLNLDTLKTSLQEIEKIGIESPSILKEISIVNDELQKLDSLKINLDLNFDLSNKIEEIQTVLSKTAQDLKLSMSIEPDITYKANSDNLEMIKNEFNKIELTFNPDTELIDKIQTELDNKTFNVKVNPVFDNSPVIETRNDTDFKVIKEERNDVNSDKLLVYMEENNKLLNTLITSLNNKNKSEKETISVVPEQVANPESIVNVTPQIQTTSVQQGNNEMGMVVGLLKELVESNKAIVKKMTKSGFNTDIDL